MTEVLKAVPVAKMVTGDTFHLDYESADKVVRLTSLVGITWLRTRGSGFVNSLHVVSVTDEWRAVPGIVPELDL